MQEAQRVSHNVRTGRWGAAVLVHDTVADETESMAGWSASSILNGVWLAVRRSCLTRVGRWYLTVR